MKKALIIIGIIAVVIVGIFLVVFNTLNKEKTPITADTFNTIMTEKGYVMTDTTSQFAQYGSLMTKSYAAQKSGYQIEFYELSNEENAISMYNTNKAKFESQKANASTSATASMNNYAIFSLTTNGKYKYVSRIDNTLIYIDANTDYKNSIKSVVKEMGY